MLEDFTPAVNPPKEIGGYPRSKYWTPLTLGPDDPEDFKPETWVDDELIDDVNASKVRGCRVQLGIC